MSQPGLPDTPESAYTATALAAHCAPVNPCCRHSAPAEPPLSHQRRSADTGEPLVSLGPGRQAGHRAGGRRGRGALVHGHHAIVLYRHLAADDQMPNGYRGARVTSTAPCRLPRRSTRNLPFSRSLACGTASMSVTFTLFR